MVINCLHGVWRWKVNILWILEVSKSKSWVNSATVENIDYWQLMEFLYLLIIDRPFTAELCIGTSFRVRVKVEPINNASSWVGYKLCIAIV